MVIPPTVFHPRYFFTSAFMADFLKLQDLRRKRVLDLGCGSGILSLVAAKNKAQVTSIDTNPAAVQSTRVNAHLNHLSGTITARVSDMFESLDPDGKSFDVILSNPPYYQAEPASMTEKAFKGGRNNDFLRRLATSLPQFLHPDGKLLLVLSSDIDSRQLLSPFRADNFLVEEVESKKLTFETLTIWQIRRIP
jgi:release factor glutamine methyltransferase